MRQDYKNKVSKQTADLIEVRTETSQNISEIKDTLKSLLHKEIETEKENYMLCLTIVNNKRNTML